MQRTYLVDSRLTMNPSKKAKILPLGDMHLGAKTCLFDEAQEVVEMCLKKHIYVLGMGDYLEMAVKDSPGDSVFLQTLNPEQQIDAIVGLFQPLHDAGLLLGMHQGNHEMRLSKNAGINIARMICKIIGTRFLSHSAFHLLRVGGESYTAFSTHGSAGARLPWTKIKCAMDAFRFVDTELVLMGHLHGLDHTTALFSKIDKRSKTVIELKRHAILTGSYLGYKGSYAEEKNMPPVQTGSPIISLRGDKHEIRVSL